MTGLSPLLYWTTNFIYDLLNYAFSAALTLLVIFIIGMPVYKSLENLEAFALLMALFGISTIPMVYAVCSCQLEGTNICLIYHIRLDLPMQFF
ncbi:hypothetical protein COOONC_06208 [Cooperia oncophora]